MSAAQTQTKITAVMPITSVARRVISAAGVVADPKMLVGLMALRRDRATHVPAATRVDTPENA